MGSPDPHWAICNFLPLRNKRSVKWSGLRIGVFPWFTPSALASSVSAFWSSAVMRYTRHIDVTTRATEREQLLRLHLRLGSRSSMGPLPLLLRPPMMNLDIRWPALGTFDLHRENILSQRITSFPKHPSIFMWPMARSNFRTSPITCPSTGSLSYFVAMTWSKVWALSTMNFIVRQHQKVVNLKTVNKRITKSVKIMCEPKERFRRLFVQPRSAFKVFYKK